MKDLVESACWLQAEVDKLGLPNCVIGGLALQAWGENRMTRDVDFTILVGFEDNELQVRRLLQVVLPRIENALEFALKNRVLLATVNKVPVDIGLGGFPFEEQMISRSVSIEYLPERKLRVCTAEDLIVLKTFAGRGQDWLDIQNIIYRQPTLNWTLIEQELKELLAYIDAQERLGQLLAMR